MESTKKKAAARPGLLATVATLALAAGIGFGGMTAGTAPVQADAVRIEAPAQQLGFADVVEQVSPAVVSVRVSARIEPASDRGGRFSMEIPGMQDLPDDHPLKRFFRDFGYGERDQDRRTERRQRRGDVPRPTSQGSGFFVSEDGFLVTNNHVIDGGSEFTVVMDDGTELSAELVGTDRRTDLAVLKVEADREFTYVAFADDAGARVGDWVVAVGNPFGLGGTVTAGIISARGRDIGAGPYDDFIQIDAAVNRGNSGGPAFNLNGEVVGVNTAIFSPSGGNVGIAFAIPSTTARDVVTTLMTGQDIERGWLGVQIQPVTAEIAESIGLEGTRGALISDTPGDSPALAAGVRAGDVIVSVDGRDVASPRELARLIGGIEPGTAVTLEVWRNGAGETIEVTLGEMPGDERVAAADPRPQQQQPSADTLEGFGLTVTPADDGRGVVVTRVEPGSGAEERGIEVGDVIVAVNSRDVLNAADVNEAVAAATEAGRRQVLVQVLRDDASRFVALPVARG